eukprot:COSAG04_NODE_513_length_13214_cov_17.630576_7_plen_94_part_00
MIRGFPLAGVRSPELVWRGAGFVKKHKKTVEQFMEMCAKASNAAPQVQAFIDILTASSEFQVFVVRFARHRSCPQCAGLRPVVCFSSQHACRT